MKLKNLVPSMNALTRLTYAFLCIAFLVPLLMTIFNFFGISSSTYLPYTAWLVGLLLFFAFLPGRVGEMFY